MLANRTFYMNQYFKVPGTGTNVEMIPVPMNYYYGNWFIFTVVPHRYFGAGTR